MKHTPGPWEFDEYKLPDDRVCYRIFGERVNRLCTPIAFTFMSAELSKSNAKLIASAPDLLKCLQIIHTYAATVEASHNDEIFLAKLKKEMQPILDEIEKTMNGTGLNE